MTRKKLSLLLLFGPLILGCGKKEPEAINIGAILPLTGDADVYGKAIRTGIELGLSELLSQGERRIQVIYEDDKSTAAGGVSAVEKLMAVDNVVAIIGGAQSSVAKAIAPITESKGMTLISPTATDPELSKIGTHFFRLWPSDTYGGKVIADFAYDSLSLTNVSLLYINSDYGKGISEVFKKVFEGHGGRVLSEDSYLPGATNFRAQLSKIKGVRPQAVYIPGYVKQLVNILRQSAELGLKVRFLSNDSFYDEQVLTVAGQAAEGAVFTYPTFDTASAKPLVRNFINEHKKRFQQTPNAFAVQGYDAIKILSMAVTKSETSGLDLAVALRSMKDFQGVGGLISFDEHGDVQKALRFLTVKDSKFAAFER